MSSGSSITIIIACIVCIQLCNQVKFTHALEAKEAMFVTGDVLLESLKATGGDISPYGCIKFGKALVSEIAKKKLDGLEDKSDEDLVEVLETLRDARVIKAPKVVKFMFNRTADSCQNVLNNVGKAMTKEERNISPEIELSDFSGSDSDSDSETDSEFDSDNENEFEMKTFKGPTKQEMDEILL